MKITVLYGSARRNGSSAKGAKEILEKVRRADDEVMRRRLELNGFDNLGIVRETLTVDLRSATGNPVLLRMGDWYSRRQRKKNEKLIGKICARVEGRRSHIAPSGNQNNALIRTI